MSSATAKILGRHAFLLLVVSFKVYENFSNDDNLGTIPANKMTGSVAIMMLQHLSLKSGRESGGGSNHAAHT